MDETNYRHFLITRFNVKDTGWVSDKNNNAVGGLSEAWLSKRFELFDAFCFPSVKAQVNSHFKWLVYFDVDTPEVYKTRIQQYQKLFPNFQPCYIPDVTQLGDSIKKYIAIECAVQINPVVITTRLDNDDSLSETFIDTVQTFIKKRNIKHGVVDLPYGFCLQIGAEPALFASIQFSNAFITCVEPFISQNALLTVLSRKHPEWAYSVDTYFINHKRLWLQVIHENNLLNNVDGVMTEHGHLLSFNFNETVTFPVVKTATVLLTKYVKSPLYYVWKHIKKTRKMLRILKRITKDNNNHL